MEHDLSFEETLPAFVGGRVDADTAKRFVDHMRVCTRCFSVWRDATKHRDLPQPERSQLRSAKWTLRKRCLLSAVVLLTVAVASLFLLQVIRWRAAQPKDIIAALATMHVADRHRPYQPRLSVGLANRDLLASTRGEKEQPLAAEIFSAAARIEREASQRPTPDNLHALGVVRVLLGRFDSAIDALQRAAAADRSNDAFQSDLAAAYLARATRTRTTGSDYAAAGETLSKLVAGGHGRSNPIVLFNLALAFEGLENRIAAERTWNGYLAVDRTSPWAEEARRHLRELHSGAPKPPAAITPAKASNRDWVCADPLRARRYAESQILGEWAHAMHRNDLPGAAKALDTLRKVGEGLRACSRDTSFVTMAAALDPALSSDARLRLAATAIIALQSANESAKGNQGRPIAEAYELAVSSLREAGLPIHQLAAGHAAFQYYYIGDAVAARRILDGTTRDESGSPGWAAQLDWVDGMIHLAGGSPFRSIELYRNALRLFEQSREARNVAAMEMLLAENFTMLGAFEEAWPYRLGALSALAHNGDSEREQIALNEAAEAALAAQYPFVALAYQESAETIARQDQNPSSKTYSALWLALIRERCALHDEAAASIRRARELAQEIRDDDSRRRAEAEIDFAEGVLSQESEPQRSLALWSSALAYTRAVDHHYRTAQILLARARVFRRLGQTERSQSDLLEGLREFEGQRQLVTDETLRTSYFGRASDLFDELISLLLDRGEVAEARDVAERRRERTLLDAIELRVGEAPVSSTVVRSVLRDDEVMIEYALLADHLVRWEIRSSSIRVSTLPIAKEDLRKQIDAAYSAAANGRISLEQKAALTWLRRTLIPFEHGPRRLIIVPDASLASVPFGALLDERSGLFLIETSSIEISPSASLFVTCRKREHRLAPSAKPGRVPRALVFGDTRPVPALSLPALPGAAAELRSAAVAWSTVPILDGAATKRAFLRAAPGADIVYVAGHAVPIGFLTHPALVTAIDGTHGGDLLAVEEIRGSRLDSRLIVLAACGTAAGRGEGVTSLVRAFLVAGASSVAGSLLPVDDRATNQLMNPFARAVVAGLPPAEALPLVQRQAIARDRGGDPLAWAGFQIYGSASLPITDHSPTGRRARGGTP